MLMLGFLAETKKRNIGEVLSRYFTTSMPAPAYQGDQLGAAANFDDLVKFGDRRQIRRSQMFIKLAFEFGCDVILMSHPITRSLASKLR